MAPKNQRWWLTQDSEQIVIAATPESLYQMVADLCRMGEWSPECQAVEWEDGATGPAEGARFVGHNRGGPRGLMRWSVGAASPSLKLDGSLPSSPRRVATSPPCGTTASSPSPAVRRSPSPTTSSGFPLGHGYSTSRPTDTANSSKACGTRSSSSRLPPRP